MTVVRVVAPDDPTLDWGDPALGRYVAAVANLPSAERLANGTFETAALQVGGRAFPVVAPAPCGAQPWLLSTRVAYGPAAREEIRREVRGTAAAAYGLAARGMEGVLHVAAADRAVFVNHPLVSTSLWGGWDGADLPEALAALTDAWPDRALIFRSLTDWSDRALRARLAEAGARLIPTRVIWAVDDVERDWRSRRDARRDRGLAVSQGYQAEEPAALSAEDWTRVRALYRGLYLQRHSQFNPDYRTPVLQAAADSGAFRFHLLRRIEDRRIDAFAASHTAGDVLSTPLLGYDTTLPQSLGLYRMAMTLPAERAASAGLRMNLSAGAGGFKRNRGAQPHLEVMAVFDAHLPAWRRAGYAALSRVLDALTPSLLRIACA